MSFHKKYADNKPLNDALQLHRLPHNKPSQLADSFRAGWFAKQRHIEDAASVAEAPSEQEASNIIPKGDLSKVWHAADEVCEWLNYETPENSASLLKTIETLNEEMMRAEIRASRAALASQEEAPAPGEPVSISNAYQTLARLTGACPYPDKESRSIWRRAVAHTLQDNVRMRANAPSDPAIAQAVLDEDIDALWDKAGKTGLGYMATYMQAREFAKLLTSLTQQAAPKDQS